MFSKLILIQSKRFRCLLVNEISFKRFFNSFDNKLIKSHINGQKNSVLSVRSFCDKINDNINNNTNKRFIETKVNSFDKQNENLSEIRAKKISKRSELFYIIVEKPNQLIEWIEKTPKEKKKNLLFSAVIKYLLKPMGWVLALTLAYLYINSDVNPITGRECVYSIPKELSDEIETDIFQEIFTQNMKSGKFLPSTDPLVKRLDNCFEKLIESNNDLDVIGGGIWTPVVINDDHICDIIVLKESQNIFVYKKILELCESEDELAYVLAHQLSHVMLDHRREPIAYTPLFFAPFLAILPKLWLVGKDPIIRFDIFNKLDTFLENKVKAFVRSTLTFSPYNEELEEEADRIAMQLMTRSCFDIRKCRQFCKKYRSLSETDSKLKDENKTQRNKGNENDFFRKHPITEQKLLYLFQYIKPFIELRKVCNCKQLSE